ncbi:MAG: hypothetical protein IPK68_18320 [Bdellovibrionales bacterium]|nr:hypothetical protein [Bdellovibrionales bacterium]
MNFFLVNIFLFTLAIAIGCSKLSKPDTDASFESQTRDNDQTIFGTALKYMASEHFEAAIVELDKILKTIRILSLVWWLSSTKLPLWKDWNNVRRPLLSIGRL